MFEALRRHFWLIMVDGLAALLVLALIAGATSSNVAIACLLALPVLFAAMLLAGAAE